MPRLKQVQNDTNNEDITLLIQNAIWTCMAFHFSAEYSLRYINNGLLGFEKNKNGKDKLDNTGKKIPRTIGYATFFRYRKKLANPPLIYKELHNFAMNGYAILLHQMKEEIATLHRMSAENLLSLKDPLERQVIIDSMCKNILPIEAAFADMLKSMVDRGIINTSKELVSSDVQNNPE